MFNNQIIAGSSGQGGEVQQSLKFNDDESQYLSWTPAAAGNRKTWTWSGWVKRGNLGTTQQLFHAKDGVNYVQIGFSTANKLQFQMGTPRRRTNRLFQDTGAWYHIVAVLDTTDATGDDRLQLWVNGKRQTSFDEDTDPTLNADYTVNNTVQHHIGRGDATHYADGYLSDIHFIDGQALDATSFGQFTNGYWKAKDYAGTYGTNGFRLTFQDDVVSEGFNCITYLGNGGTQSLSGLGMAADLVWIKERSSTSGHVLTDTVRGVNKHLVSSSTGAETTVSNGLTSFDADGFSVGSNGAYNQSGQTYVGWAWDAGSGSAVSNTDGTITSTVKANPAYGFSIVSYTGTGSAATIGHGLSSAPDMIITKARGQAENWGVYHSDVGNNKALFLNLTNAESSASNAYWNNASPTSSVFSVNTSTSTNAANTMIAYCFAEVAGYSSFGSYSGTGVSGNSVTGLGFKPAWLMIKSSAGATNDWFIYDNTRQPTNPKDLELYANLSSAEFDSGRNVTFTDDGFDLDTVNYVNNSGVTYIYMAFADTREAAFWKDVSGQGNNWTPNNLDYRDSLPDSPANNWATFNPLSKALYQPTFSNGNLSLSVSAAWSGAAGTIGVTSGKWYWEIVNGSSDTFVGICADNLNFSVQDPQTLSGTILYYGGSGQKRVDGALTSYGAAFSTETIGVALDIDGGNITFYRNNVSQGSIPLASSTLNGKTILPYFSKYASTIIVNFGQDSTFSGTKPMGAFTDDSQLGTFQYQPPAGFKSLCTANLPTPSIISGSEHFNTVLYTGNGSTQSITGVGFGSAPDFVWIKSRTSVLNHMVFDSVRGASKYIQTSTTAAEGFSSGNFLSDFDSDGFTLQGQTAVNKSSDAFAAWNWKAGGAAVSNTDGSITSQVSANTDMGFSIISYQGNGTAGTSIGHGLSSAPELIICKNRSAAQNWLVQGDAIGDPTAGNFLLLESTAAKSANNTVNTTLGASTITLDTSATYNGSGNDHIIYAFHSSDVIKAGSYTGNGSTDGPFVFTGFRPAWVMVKASSTSGESWNIVDDTRNEYNGAKSLLFPNLTNAEANATNGIDLLSNGFKLRDNIGNYNSSGVTYIYLAFAENPFKYANAR